jgi:hypothetical protein
MIFQSPGKGWTESYFFNYVSDDIKAAFEPMSFLAGRRAQLLGTNAYVKAIRVALVISALGVVQKNKSKLRKIRYDPSPQIVGNQLAEGDVCVLSMLRNADQSRKKASYLRGIPDAIEFDDGTYNPDGAAGWGARYDAYIERMKLIGGGASNLGWWGYVPFPEAAIQTYSVVAATSIVTITMPAGTFAAFDPGKKLSVRIRGVNVHSVLNGSQVITVVDPATCKITKPLACGPFVSGGEMIIYTRSLIPVADADVPSITTHKTGAPLLESPGRLRARART